jgi:Zn-dependent protease
VFDDRLAIRLFQFAGIEVRLHASVALIFTLVVFGLANGALTEWHSDWSGTAIWSVSLVCGVLFLFSLLAHEFSHALVAVREGMEVPRITLFLFGGVAEIAEEAPTPAIEFRVAAAGPAMSFVLSVLFYLLFLQFAEDGLFDENLSVENFFASLSPVPTACLWLAIVNFTLGLFNLIPGFPLDGGRLFRAVLWWWSGDQIAATRLAAQSGTIFGWVIAILGGVIFINGDIVGGLWLVLIGWFLVRLAKASIAQLLVSRALTGMRVKDLMRTRFESVDADTTLQRFVDDYLLRSPQILWPVRKQGHDVGVLDLNQVSNIDLGSSGHERLLIHATPLSELETLQPDLDGREAITRLSANPSTPTVVVHDGVVVGILHHGDILKWLAFHEGM